MARQNNNKIKVEKAFETLRTGVVELIQNPAKLEATMQHYYEVIPHNNYSPRNTMLLILQCGARGHIFNLARGYKQWQKEFQRNVKKGEKGMNILAPLIRKEINEDGEEETICYGFRAITVFELHQTEGEAIPQPSKDDRYKTEKEYKLQDFIKATGVTVELEDMLEANGYTNGKRIAIATHNNETAQICTLFHELAHYHLHFKAGNEEQVYSTADSTSLKELEAEAVSYMVSSALGIENKYSKTYISNWNKNNKEIDKEFANRADKLLMEALNQIELFRDLI